jgi:hypothetical protein
MNTLNPFSLVPALLALQFAVFGWRIAREITLGDEGRRTWLLLSDFLNLISMLAVVSFCVVVPLRTGVFSILSKAILGVGYVLICFTPLIIAGHYRLFSRMGRTIYEEPGRDYPWLTGQEAFLAVLALLAAVGAAYAIGAG